MTPGPHEANRRDLCELYSDPPDRALISEKIRSEFSQARLHFRPE